MMVGRIIKGIRLISSDLNQLVQREFDFHGCTPKTSTLFLTYRCNSQCRTCTLWQRPVKQEKDKEVGFREWKTIIDRLVEAGVGETEIFGGNVLLRKALLLDVLRYLHSKHVIVHLPTNQIGLDEDIAQAVIAYVDSLYISTDGIGEYQDSIRGQAGAKDRVEQTITMLSRLKHDRRAERPRLICNTTVSRYNVDILEQLVEYARRMNFDEIHFEYAGEFTQEHIDHSHIDGLRPTPYYIKQDESILVDRVGAKRLKESIRKIKKKYAPGEIKINTINIDTLSEKNIYKGTIPHKKCYVERTEVTIDPSGEVVICPFINNYGLGNILDTPLDEIWDNEKHRKFRAYQNRGDIELCAHCILGVQRNPGPLRMLRRIFLRRFEPSWYKLVHRPVDQT